MRTDCKNYRDDTTSGGPWCDALKWRLNKGFTSDPCEMCIKNSNNFKLGKKENGQSAKKKVEKK